MIDKNKIPRMLLIVGIAANIATYLYAGSSYLLRRKIEVYPHPSLTALALLVAVIFLGYLLILFSGIFTRRAKEIITYLLIWPILGQIIMYAGILNTWLMIVILFMGAITIIISMMKMCRLFKNKDKIFL